MKSSLPTKGRPSVSGPYLTPGSSNASTSRKTLPSSRTPPDTLRSTAATGNSSFDSDVLQTMFNELMKDSKETRSRMDRLVDDISTKFEAIMAENAELKTKLAALEERVATVEQYGTKPVQNPVRTSGLNFKQLVADEVDKTRRETNIILRGVDEEGDDINRDSCAQLLGIPTTDIVTVERLGRAHQTAQPDKPRPVRVQLATRATKAAVYGRRLDLKVGSRNLYVSHDLTRSQQQARTKVVPVYKRLRALHVRCSLPYDTILDPEGTAMADSEITRLLEREQQQQQ